VLEAIRRSAKEALAKCSEAYADQAERDFKTFQVAIRSGRLSTEPAKSAGLEFLA